MSFTIDDDHLVLYLAVSITRVFSPTRSALENTGKQLYSSYIHLQSIYALTQLRPSSHTSDKLTLEPPVIVMIEQCVDWSVSWDTFERGQPTEESGRLIPF